MDEIIKMVMDRLRGIPTDELKVEVHKLTWNFSEGSDVVFDCALDVLQERMTDDEYLTFCKEF